MECICGRNGYPMNAVSCPVHGTWRSIETAPRDGTWVDLWAHGQRFASCSWVSDDTALRTGWQQKFAEVDNEFYLGDDFRPTHWMPLPDPPRILPFASMKDVGKVE